MHTCTCMTHSYTYIQIHTEMHITHVSSCWKMCIYSTFYIGTHTHTYVCAYVSVCGFMYTHIFTYICAFVL